MNPTAYSFVLADNQDITRMGIRGYIGCLFGESLVTEVSGKKELTDVLTEHPASVVVLDYPLFDLNGIEEFLILLRRFTGACWLLFSTDLSEDFIRKLSAEEAVSMVLKENTGEEIRSALLCAARRERFLCHQITHLLLSNTNTPKPPCVLTATEKEILRQIARGRSVKEIAAERVSSIHTIVTHKKNIFRKLEVNNVYEATKYALRAGLVEMAEYYI